MKYLVKDVYETIDTAVPFAAWCRKNGLDPEEEVNESTFCKIVMSSRNADAKDRYADKVAVNADRVERLDLTFHSTNSLLPPGWAAEGGEVTVSSRVMADYLGMEHKNILKAIDRELKELMRTAPLGAVLPSHVAKAVAGFKESFYITSQNKVQKQYELNERAAHQICARYSSQHRAKVIDLFLTLREHHIRYLEAATLALGDPTLRPLPRKVYLLWDDVNELTKIGIAKDPESRLAQGRTFCQSLDLVWESPLATNAATIEANAHKHFKDSCKFGEWFEIKPQEALDFLKTQEFLLSI